MTNVPVRAPAAVPTMLPMARSSAGSDAEAADRLTARIRQVLRRSLHVRHLDAGSCNGCDWEIQALLGPAYDIQRLGIDIVASPRHADLLLVTGSVTRNLHDATWRTYEAMPRPGLVVAVGACACGGGVLQGSYCTAGGVSNILPVDVYVPGCPPRPHALIQGLLVAVDRLEPRLQHGEFIRMPGDRQDGGQDAQDGRAASWQTFEDTDSFPT